MKLRSLFARTSTNLDWWRFLRSRLRLLTAWTISLIFLGIVSWTLLLTGLAHDRDNANRHALDEAQALAHAYAAYLAQTVTTIDQLTLHVRYEWDLSEGTLPLETIHETGILSSSERFHVFITDANGQIVTGTVPPPQPDVADQLYYLRQRDALDDKLYIGEAMLDPSGRRNALPFSRRLFDQEGGFSGIVLVSVAADYLTTPYGTASVGNAGFLGVAGLDGSVRVTRIGSESYPAEAPALRQIPRFNQPFGAIPMNGATWFSDGRHRFVGWQAVAGYPLIAIAGLERSEALAPFHAARTAALQGAGWTTLAMTAFVLTAFAYSIRLSWSKFQVELTQAAYRMATEEGNEGFYILRPQIDASGKVRDCETIDCNQQGAAFYGLRREQLIGRMMSSIYDGDTFDRLIERMQQAKDHGAYESEVEMPSSAPLRARWLHVKIVRSNGYLALRQRDLTDTKAHVEALERRGNEDALTGLPNRHWTNTYLPRALERAQRDNRMLALLFIDLDGFKAVNDTMGHEAGDQLLRTAGRRLHDAVRPDDKVARIGGDEFVVVLEDLEHKEDAAHVAERVLQAFRQNFRLSHGIASVGTSIGIAVYPEDGQDADTLLKHADIAMYAVKTSGKRNYGFYDQRFYESVRDRHRQEAELRAAIEQDQFVMHYQPRVDMVSGVTAGLEALLRWQHPDYGLLLPEKFIQVAEESGLIVRIGELVIDKVCKQIADWAEQDTPPVIVSINVSPRQFKDADVAQQLAAAIDRHGIDPALVEVELTESSMMDEQEAFSAMLDKIRSLGVKLLIDDFGTGYSSLSQLQALDFDVLKVDRSFTSQLGQSRKSDVFFKAIITMAHSLGMRVVAEGVETTEQIAMLRALDCDEIQGFYISRPLPPAETRALLDGTLLPSG